jgi:hypothetical protein
VRGRHRRINLTEIQSKTGFAENSAGLRAAHYREEAARFRSLAELEPVAALQRHRRRAAQPRRVALPSRTGSRDCRLRQAEGYRSRGRQAYERVTAAAPIIKAGPQQQNRATARDQGYALEYEAHYLQSHFRAHSKAPRRCPRASMGEGKLLDILLTDPTTVAGCDETTQSRRVRQNNAVSPRVCPLAYRNEPNIGKLERVVFGFERSLSWQSSCAFRRGEAVEQLPDGGANGIEVSCRGVG